MVTLGELGHAPHIATPFTMFGGGGGGGKEGVKEQRTMCVGCLNRYSLFSDELFILSNDFGQFHWQFEALLRDSLQSPPPLQTDA